MRQKGTLQARGLAALPMEQLLRAAAESLGVGIRGGDWEDVRGGRPVYRFIAQETELAFPVDAYQIEAFAEATGDDLQVLEDEVTESLLAFLRQELQLS